MSMHLVDLSHYADVNASSTSHPTDLRLVKSARDCAIYSLHPQQPSGHAFAALPEIPEGELNAVVTRIKAGFYSQAMVLSDIAHQLSSSLRVAHR